MWGDVPIVGEVTGSLPFTGEEENVLFLYCDVDGGNGVYRMTAGQFMAFCVCIQTYPWFRKAQKWSWTGVPL